MNTRISKLDVIKGKTVADATLKIGDAGIELTNGIQVAIYNSFDIKSKQSLSDGDLVGRTVIDVEESVGLVKIVFDGDVSLNIDMRDGAFNGPEAIQLIVPGEPIVIWN